MRDLGDERDEKKLSENEKTTRLCGVEHNGRFRLENVPPGRWNLYVLLFRNTLSTGRIRVGEAFVPVIVEEFPGKISEESQELGTLNVRRILTPEERLAKVGTVVANFELKRLLGEKGETVKLSDFRGKTVVLEFWATWCGPCLRKIPELSAFYEKIKDDPNIVLLAISLDDEETQAVEFLQKRDLPWIQLHAAWPSPLTDSLGFEGIPAMFVLDPEGRITMIDPTTEELNSLRDAGK